MRRLSWVFSRIAFVMYALHRGTLKTCLDSSAQDANVPSKLMPLQQLFAKQGYIDMLSLNFCPSDMQHGTNHGKKQTWFH